MRLSVPTVLPALAAALLAAPARAQQCPAPPADKAASVSPGIVVDPAPSFSSLALDLTHRESGPDAACRKNITRTFDLQLKQPFKSSPFGAPVTEAGLGAVQSAQFVFTLVRSDLIGPLPRAVRPVDSLQLLAAIGHRGFDVPGAGMLVDHVDRVPYALGLEWEHRPGNPASFAGRLSFVLGVQYRRQYLPAVTGGPPARVDNVIVDAALGGALARFPLLSRGLGYRLKLGYDVARGVPGAELALNTAVLDYPRIVVGVSFWFQARDDDPRTRDKRFDLSPHLNLQF